VSIIFFFKFAAHVLGVIDRNIRDDDDDDRRSLTPFPIILTTLSSSSSPPFSLNLTGRPVQTSGMTAALMMDDADYDASRAPLQVTLAAQLGFEPEEMMRVKEGLFPGGDGTGGDGTARQRSHYQHHRHPMVSAAPARIPQRQTLSSGLLLSKKRQEEPRQGKEDSTMAEEEEEQQQQQQQQQQGGGVGAVSNVWQKQRPALLPPSFSSSSQRPQPSSTQTLMPQLPASPTPVSALKLLPPSMLCPVPFPRSTTPSGPFLNNNNNNNNNNNERCLPDAGLLLGSSFRSGWSLDGRFAAPGRGGDGGRNNDSSITAAQVGLVKVKVGGGSRNNNNDKMKGVLEQLLTVHLSWSNGVVVNGDDDVVVNAPKWSVKCSRREELAQLTSQLAQLCSDNSDEISSHQAETWHLVDVLFSELPAEAQQERHSSMRLSSPMSNLTSPDEQEEEEDLEDLEDDELVSLDLGRLITFQRRAMLSHWLKSVVSSRVASDIAALSGTSTTTNNNGGEDDDDEKEEEEKIGAKILAHLSGHQLIAACSTAIAAGNVRLATLLAKAGCSSNHYNNRGIKQQQTSLPATTEAAAAPLAPRTQLNLQLSVWQDAGFLDHISPTLIKIYELLAGRVDDVIPHLFDIITMHGDTITTDDDVDDNDEGYESREDWRRCLGMHLWYGCPPTATIGEILSSYTDAAEAGVAPPPLPKYCERPDNNNKRRSNSGGGGGVNDESDSNDDEGEVVVPFGGARDVSFELLRLHAVAADMGQPPALIDNENGATTMMMTGSTNGSSRDNNSSSNVEDYSLAIAPLIPRLLRPAGITPDPLDHSFTWCLSTVLLSIGAIPSGYKGEELFATCMGFVSQLILLDGQGAAGGGGGGGDMCHWAIYVALHLPDDNLRTSVVQHLLCGFCDSWERDEQKMAFFKETLGIPASWLATARALRAHSLSSSSSSGSVDVELECLLEAEAWEEAHRLLISHAAPAWVIAGTPLALSRLREATSRLEQQYFAASGENTGSLSSSSSSMWCTGGGLYAAYVLLKDDYEGEWYADKDAAEAVFTSQEERKEACLKLGAALERRGGESMRSSHGDKKQAALRYAALTRMKLEVKKWLSTMGQEGSGRGGGFPNVEE